MSDDLIARLHIIAYECYEQHGPDRWVTAVEEAAAALEAAERQLAELEGALELYRDAVRIDVLMEGPRFAGSNVSALKRAWEHDRAVLIAEKGDEW